MESDVISEFLNRLKEKYACDPQCPCKEKDSIERYEIDKEEMEDVMGALKSQLQCIYNFIGLEDCTHAAFHLGMSFITLRKLEKVLGIEDKKNEE